MSPQRTNRWLVHCRFTILLAFCLVAPTTSNAREPLTPQALMQLIGLEQSFEGIAQQLSDINDPNLRAKAEADPKFRKAWIDAAQGAFIAKDMRNKMEGYLANALTPAEQQQIVKLYSSGIGKKATDVERQAQSPDARQQMMENKASILAELNAQPKRQQMYRQIEQLLNMVEGAADSAMNMALAMSIGLATANTSAMKPTAQDLRELIERQRPAMTVAIEQYIPLSMAFTYKSLTLEELATYKSLLQRTVVKKLYRIVTDASSAVMLDAGMAFGRKLAINLNVEPI